VEDYGYSMDMRLSRCLTDEEKVLLVMALNEAVERILGRAKGGFVMFHTPKQNPSDGEAAKD